MWATKEQLATQKKDLDALRAELDRARSTQMDALSQVEQRVAAMGAAVTANMQAMSELRMALHEQIENIGRTARLMSERVDQFLLGEPNGSLVTSINPRAAQEMRGAVQRGDEALAGVMSPYFDPPAMPIEPEPLVAPDATPSPSEDLPPFVRRLRHSLPEGCVISDWSVDAYGGLNDFESISVKIEYDGGFLNVVLRPGEDMEERVRETALFLCAERFEETEAVE